MLAHIAASGEPVVPRTATGSPSAALTASEIFANHLLRSKLGKRYNDEIWLKYGLDTILVPSAAHPAPPHGKYVSNSYATVYNMLDYVAGCVPVTRVDCDVDKAGEDWYDEKDIYEDVEELGNGIFPYDYGDRKMKEMCK